MLETFQRRRISTRLWDAVPDLIGEATENQWRIQMFRLGGDMASAGARAYITGVWGAAPSGVQGRAPGQGFRGETT